MKTSDKNEANFSLVNFGEQVIKDTLLLIGRLETDRVNTAQSLAKEKQRVEMLKSKITEYTHRRMHFMPIAVQKGISLSVNTYKKYLQWCALPLWSSGLSQTLIKNSVVRYLYDMSFGRIFIFFVFNGPR